MPPALRYLLNSLATLLLGAAALPARAQQPRYTVRRLQLPAEIEYYDNQFSGLATGAGKLYFMSESRLQDQAEAKLYAVPLADLDQQLRDSTHALPYQKLPLLGLPALRRRMAAAGQSYEGLEAMLLDHETAYFTVETATPSANCYLLRGTVGATAVALDTTFLLPLPKPLAPDGSHIYNAGYEALAAQGKRLFAVFEYNSFAAPNYVLELDKKCLGSTSAPVPRQLDQLPFRLTDLTAAPGGKGYVGINYFFKGDGGDAVYRPAAGDAANNAFVRAGSGYKNYCRLLRIELTGNTLSWQPLWEFPERYRGYNWEGLAAYKEGFFVVNDKYTPAKPYKTTLLYLQPAGR